jgi:hypothetical protein
VKLFIEEYQNLLHTLIRNPKTLQFDYFTTNIPHPLLKQSPFIRKRSVNLEDYKGLSYDEKEGNIGKIKHEMLVRLNQKQKKERKADLKKRRLRK